MPTVVSSTIVRRALERGDVAAAGSPWAAITRCRGAWYRASGSAAFSAFRRPISRSAPTNRLAHGVYAVWALVGGRPHPGVASFGVRPTVDNGPPLLEVHLLDFEGDLYGQDTTVEFVERIREERKI